MTFNEKLIGVGRMKATSCQLKIIIKSIVVNAFVAHGDITLKILKEIFFFCALSFLSCSSTISSSRPSFVIRCEIGSAGEKSNELQLNESEIIVQCADECSQFRSFLMLINMANNNNLRVTIKIVKQ